MLLIEPHCAIEPIKYIFRVYFVLEEPLNVMNGFEHWIGT